MYNIAHKKGKAQVDIFLKYGLLTQKTSISFYESVMKDAVHLLDAKHGSIFLKGDGRLTHVYSDNPQLSTLNPRPHGDIDQTFHSKSAVIRPIEKTNKKLKSLFNDVQSVLFIPICYKNTTIGVIRLLSTSKEEFSKKDMQLLELFGDTLGYAIISNHEFAKVSHLLKRRDLFISLAAHELKNPLTVIRAFAQLIANKSAKQETVKLELPNKIIQESGRIAYLINELMQAGQIRKNVLKYDFRRNSLRSLIKSAIEDAQISHPDFPILFKNKLKDENDYIEGDYEKLMQVVINIINNAIKFSPYGSPITLSLRKNDEYFIISIQDKGIGIAKDEQEKIFEEFHKGATHKKAGLGLGLFIAKTIIEKHNGFIRVKSELGKGTRMNIYLPIKRVTTIVA